MIRIFYSNDKCLIQKKINELINHKEYLYFDFDNDYQNILNTINQYSLFNNTNIIVINNCNFLKSNELIAKEQNIINQINNDSKNDIFLIVESNKIASSIDKYIFNCEKNYIQELTEWTMSNYLNKILKEKNIFLSKNDFDKLKSKLIPNHGIIDNEVNKLIFFNKHEISEEIDSIITDYHNDNIFDLSYYFFQKDYKKMFFLLNKLLNKNYSSEQIINILINQFLKYKIYLLFLSNNNNNNYEKFKLTFNINNFIFGKLKNIIEILNLKGLDKNINLLYNIDRFYKLGYLKSQQALLCFLIGDYDE